MLKSFLFTFLKNDLKWGEMKILLCHSTTNDLATSCRFHHPLHMTYKRKERTKLKQRIPLFNLDYQTTCVNTMAIWIIKLLIAEFNVTSFSSIPYSRNIKNFLFNSIRNNSHTPENKMSMLVGRALQFSFSFSPRASKVNCIAK